MPTAAVRLCALAESIGINAARHKTFAFVVSCFFCGVMGAVHVHYLRFVSPFVSIKTIAARSANVPSGSTVAAFVAENDARVEGQRTVGEDEERIDLDLGDLGTFGRDP